MTKKELEKIVNTIKQGRLYDYLANNYWNMSKEDLKDIALELIASRNNEELIDNLVNWRFDYLKEEED